MSPLGATLWPTSSGERSFDLLLVLLAVGLLLVLRWLSVRAHRGDWGTSELRNRALAVFVAIAPMFGGAARPPEPEPPVATTPATPAADDPPLPTS